MRVLTGLTAARVRRALPRAIDVAFVAVPTQRRQLQLLDRAGQVRFVTRAVTDLDAVLITTDLGQALATTARASRCTCSAATGVLGQDLDQGEWTRALGHQAQLRVSAREAMAVVREAWLGAAE